MGQGKAINGAAHWVKAHNKVTFVDWVPTHDMKIHSASASIADTCIKTSQKSVTMLGNNVAINRKFGETNKKYDLMYSQRAYVHQYVNEGMEEGEFSEAREDMGFLEKDYLDVLTEQAEDEEDEENEEEKDEGDTEDEDDEDDED